MSVRQRRQLQTVAIAAGQTYQTEFQGAAFSRIESQVSGLYTASADGVAGLEAGHGWLGPLEIVQDEEPLISIDGVDLRWACGFRQGSTTEVGPGAIAAAGGIILASSDIDLGMFIPGTCIDARKSKVIRRGQFGSLTRMGSTVTAATGKLRTGVQTTEIVAETYFEPLWRQARVSCAVASEDISYTYRCGKQREYLGGILFRQYDHSALLTSANAARVDGLVRNITVELNNKDGTTTVWKGGWGEMKTYQQSRFGFPRTEVHTGVSMLVFDDPETPETNETLELEPGDSLTFRFDTLSTLDDQFPTAITPASGDEMVVTLFSHRLRGVGAGDGDETMRRKAQEDLARREERRKLRRAARVTGTGRRA